jgi:hypothetical protein
MTHLWTRAIGFAALRVLALLSPWCLACACNDAAPDGGAYDDGDQKVVSRRGTVENPVLCEDTSGFVCAGFASRPTDCPVDEPEFRSACGDKALLQCAYCWTDAAGDHSDVMLCGDDGWQFSGDYGCQR